MTSTLMSFGDVDVQVVAHDGPKVALRVFRKFHATMTAAEARELGAALVSAADYSDGTEPLYSALRSEDP